MKQEVNPKDTSRARAFELWMSSPVPMVTLTKTFDVTRLRKAAKARGVKFNMLLCWCVGKAASRVEEFYMLPQHGKMYRYDSIGVNVNVENVKGGINSFDIPFTDDMDQFNKDYQSLSQSVTETCESVFLDDCMVMGTSAVINTEIDSIVNQYSDKFNSPFLAWGKYRKGWFKTILPISLQFHHVQMDGKQAAGFLKLLQEEFNRV